MKMRTCLASLAFAASMLALPSQAMADPAYSCSDGSYDDHQTAQYADVGFELSEYCTESTSLYVIGTSWGPGGSYGWGGGTFWLVGLGTEYITVQVSDGIDTTSFVLQLNRPGW